ncbi:MAG: glycosyltransferase involved in cell wall biosynthesis [Candidatus Pelagisphaera sp.]|jgi:glycosyltransferase involved in cell wall biosynthesis
MDKHSQKQATGPLVSIGLPVYNGENFLSEAIESVLAQTYRNLELIICDNASTDRTEAICEKYATQDARISYHRNTTNLGAGANYDKCFHLSNGEFFKWIAHDDTIAPTFVEKTLLELKSNSSAIACVTGVMKINETGESIGYWNFEKLNLMSNSSSARLHRFLFHRPKNTDFFGLYRSCILKDSVLHGNYTHADNVFLAEMALRGQTIRIDDALFFNRIHSLQYSRSVMLSTSFNEIADWWAGKSSEMQNHTTPIVTLWRNYLKIVYSNIPPSLEKLRCYTSLFAWLFQRKIIRIFTIELLRSIAPQLYKMYRDSFYRDSYNRRFKEPSASPKVI